MSLSLRSSPAARRRRCGRWCSPLIALILTVLCGMVLFGMLGKSPWQAVSMFLVEPLATKRGVAEVLLKATPLILCAIGLALCFRANVWNIGAEGQLIVGSIAAARWRCWPRRTPAAGSWQP